MYSRLQLFKELAAHIANERPEQHKNSPLAGRLGLLAGFPRIPERATHAAHFYDLLLESCEKLFDNELEQAAFEDQLRYMFGIQVSDITVGDLTAANGTTACL